MSELTIKDYYFNKLSSIKCLNCNKLPFIYNKMVDKYNCLCNKVVIYTDFKNPSSDNSFDFYGIFLLI